MSLWQDKLNGDPIPWLLEPDNPSVRYLTLTGLLGGPPRGRQAREAQWAVMETGVVPRILDRQQKAGYWGKPESFYVRGKYRGSSWQLLTLAQLEADGTDPRVRCAAEFMLNRSQARGDGAFAYRGTARGGGDRECVIPCLTGNMVYALLHLGLGDDRRVQDGVNWITKYLRVDDGESRASPGWPYRYEKCWGQHTCMMAVVKGLKGLAEVPGRERTPETRGAITRGAEFMLRHRLVYRSHDPTVLADPEWLKLGFPRMWNTDILEMLALLLRLGYRDARMEPAIALLLSKQDETGRWTLEQTFNGRVQVNIERGGRPSKWLTLEALRVIKEWFG